MNNPVCNLGDQICVMTEDSNLSLCSKWSAGLLLFSPRDDSILEPEEHEGRGPWFAAVGAPLDGGTAKPLIDIFKLALFLPHFVSILVTGSVGIGVIHITSSWRCAIFFLCWALHLVGSIYFYFKTQLIKSLPSKRMSNRYFCTLAQQTLIIQSSNKIMNLIYL